MPKIDCKGGCGREVRNPPSRNITGFCAVCLGLERKTPLVIVISEENLDKLNLKERQLNFLADIKLDRNTLK